MDYMLVRWEAFARFLGDGRICLTNNAAEEAVAELPAAMMSASGSGAVAA
jgi:hypothetical protein